MVFAMNNSVGAALEGGDGGTGSGVEGDEVGSGERGRGEEETEAALQTDPGTLATTTSSCGHQGQTSSTGYDVMPIGNTVVHI